MIKWITPPRLPDHGSPLWLLNLFSASRRALIWVHSAIKVVKNFLPTVSSTVGKIWPGELRMYWRIGLDLKLLRTIPNHPPSFHIISVRRSFQYAPPPTTRALWSWLHGSQTPHPTFTPWSGVHRSAHVHSGHWQIPIFPHWRFLVPIARSCHSCFFSRPSLSILPTANLYSNLSVPSPSPLVRNIAVTSSSLSANHWMVNIG